MSSLNSHELKRMTRVMMLSIALIILKSSFSPSLSPFFPSSNDDDNDYDNSNSNSNSNSNLCLNAYRITFCAVGMLLEGEHMHVHGVCNGTGVGCSDGSSVVRAARGHHDVHARRSHDDRHGDRHDDGVEHGAGNEEAHDVREQVHDALHSDVGGQSKLGPHMQGQQPPLGRAWNRCGHWQGQLRPFQVHS